MIDELVKEWKASGIVKGDTVLLHSNIKRTLMKYRRKGFRILPKDILLSFLDAVGSNGTIILPLFNFDFPKTGFFDIRYTPSQMGSLTEIARLHKDSIRTGHPIYSFAIIGKNSHYFINLDNKSGYGLDSPFGVLRELDGKIASLDLPDQNSMTFYHHVEEMMLVDYRYFKEFTGEYIDFDGNKSTKTYELFVRNLENNVVTDVNPAGELMWAADLYKGDKPMVKSGLRTIKANDMFDFVSGIIKANKALGTLYNFEG